MSKSATKPKNYKNPPIIEAVIELRFVESLNEQQLEKLVLKQKSKFIIQTIEEISVKFLPEEKTDQRSKAKTRIVGYKLIDRIDNSNIIQVKYNSISVSRFPPYEGWDELIADIKKYHAWYTSKKFKPLSRVGIRYINRIDIPAADNKIELEDYFKIYPHVPNTKFPDVNRFVVQTVAAIDDEKMLTLNMGTANEAPLLKHTSIIFDLDVAQSRNLPLNDTKLYRLLEDIRNKKNSFFEDLLTPKCKRLFK